MKLLRHYLFLLLGLFLFAFSAGEAKKENSAHAILAKLEISDLGGSKSSRLGEQVKTDADVKKPLLKASKGDQSREVSKQEYSIREKQLIEEIKFQIAKHFGITDDFRLFFERPWNEIKIHQPAWQVEMTSYPPQGLRNRFYVGFEIWAEGKRHSSWSLGVRSELWQDAYVANQRIERGAVIGESVVSVQPVDVLSLFQPPVEIGTNLSDYVASNGIKAGQPIYMNDLRNRPLVQRNQIIEVVAEEGLMRISLKAKALEDGVKGQIIRIRNMQSYSEVQAEVIGVNRARVYF